MNTNFAKLNMVFLEEAIFLEGRAMSLFLITLKFQIIKMKKSSQITTSFKILLPTVNCDED